MVASSKSKTKSKTEKSITPAVPVKKSKISKSKEVVAKEEVVTTPIQEVEILTPVVEDVVAVDVDDKPKLEEVPQEKNADTSVEGVFYTKLSSFISKISSINKEVKELQAMGKTLEKDFNNVIKVMSKQKNKNKNSESKRASGFAMPSLLTTELYDFLGIEKGELVSRTDVTKRLNTYICENGLRRENDKRQILPDEKLKKILNCTDEDDVHYFNLQQYLKHHFIKRDAYVTPTEATVSAV